MVLVRYIAMLSVVTGFWLKIVYIKTLDNKLADPLSRLNINLFKERAPEAEQVETQAQPLRQELMMM